MTIFLLVLGAVLPAAVPLIAVPLTAVPLAAVPLAVNRHCGVRVGDAVPA